MILTATCVTDLGSKKLNFHEHWQPHFANFQRIYKNKNISFVLFLLNFTDRRNFLNN